MNHVSELVEAAHSAEGEFAEATLRDLVLKLAESQGMVKVEKEVAHRLDVGGLLLTEAVKLGIAPELAVRTLFRREGGRTIVDLDGLGELIDDQKVAAVAPARLAEPVENDLTIAQVAQSLGLDVDEIRSKAKNGTLNAQYCTS